MDPPPSNFGCLHFQSQVECNTQSPGRIPAATGADSAVEPPKRDGTAYTAPSTKYGASAADSSQENPGCGAFHPLSPAKQDDGRSRRVEPARFHRTTVRRTDGASQESLLTQNQSSPSHRNIFRLQAKKHI